MAAPETTGPVPQLYCGKCKTELTFSTKKQLPQYLCCLHTICYNCIQEIAAANKGSTSECPVCFVPFDETNTKDVFFLKDLSFSQKVVNFINGKDFSIECQNCIEETASAYCQKCEYPQFYCEECITAHDRLRLNLHHKSRSLDDMKEKGIYPNVNRPSVGLCECSDTVLTHFCRLCQQPACTKCSETDHSDHKPFVVEIYAASKEIREELVNKQLQLQNKVDILKTREKHIKYEHSRLLNSYIKTAENMTRFFDEIRGCVGEREAALHKQLMDAVDIKIKAFDIDGESTKKEIHVNNQKSEFLKCVNQYGDDIDIVTSLQTVDDQCDFTKAANEEPIDNGSIQFRVGDVTPFNENLQESVNTTDFYIKQIPKVFSNLGVIKRTTTVASLSYATLDIAGREIRVNIQAIDKNNLKCSIGGDVFTSEIEEPNGSTVKAIITDNDSGTYSFKYHCLFNGRHKINISLFSCQIMGSPMYIDVSKNKINICVNQTDDHDNIYSEIDESLYGNVEVTSARDKKKRSRLPPVPPKPQRNTTYEKVIWCKKPSQST